MNSFLPATDLDERSVVQQAMLNAGADLAQDEDPLAILRRFCNTLVTASGHIRLVWMYVGEPEVPLLRPQYAAGPARAYADELAIGLSAPERASPPRQALARHEMILKHLRENAGPASSLAAAREYGLESCLVIPFGRPGGIGRGIVSVYADLPDYFEQVGQDSFAAFGYLADAAMAQAALRQKLQRMATVDGLSGLLTRQAMQEILQRFVAQAQRQSSGFCLLLCDIDRFKIINDNYGHQAGDRVIAATAEALRGALRTEDWASRWGGEEFLCLLPGVACDGGKSLAERVRSAVAGQPVDLGDGRSVRVTVSIGVACLPIAGSTLQELLAHVDSALYDAKASGRNRVVRASTQGQSLYFMANEIDQAISEDRLRPAYQPIVRLADGETVAEEALARMVQADGQLMEAARFITQASQLQLAHRIDHAIMRQAVDHCALRIFSGQPPLTRLVNISADLLRHPELVGDLIARAKAICAACGDRIGAQKPLVIEITERELLGDLQEAKRLLEPFLDFGIRLALDDFGSGYSSFHYLAELPFSFLKISGDLIAQVNVNPRGRRILRGIQDLARDLEVITIAEGVEDTATADTLREIGIDWVQGWLYGRPRLLDAEAGTSGTPAAAAS